MARASRGETLTAFFKAREFTWSARRVQHQHGRYEHDDRLPRSCMPSKRWSTRRNAGRVEVQAPVAKEMRKHRSSANAALPLTLPDD